MLNAEQVAQFQEQGFIRIPQVYTLDEVQSLRTELDQLIQDWATTNMGWSGPWRDVLMDAETNKKSMLTHLHDLHFYSQAWCHAVTKPNIGEAMSEIIGPNVELHHTTLHVKPPETGMPFPLHQDSPFYRHDGFGFVDAIIHLDDTSHENGELRFMPGSHKSGHIEHVLQNPDGTGCSPHLPTDQWKLADTIPCPAKAGDVVAFSIYTVHGSYINQTDKWRRLVRVGYRDPALKQLAGQSLGRAGLIVHGLRPAGALAASGS
jgi:ectoine hydroxylase-related dioxygenase (phytanoyl-CoA dioxygenase family)